MSDQRTNPAKGTCRGSGEHVGSVQGGATWRQRARCRHCGKDLALRSGRIPPHVPAKRGAA